MDDLDKKRMFDDFEWMATKKALYSMLYMMPMVVMIFHTNAPLHMCMFPLVFGVFLWAVLVMNGIKEIKK